MTAIRSFAFCTSLLAAPAAAQGLGQTQAAIVLCSGAVENTPQHSQLDAPVDQAEKRLSGNASPSAIVEELAVALDDGQPSGSFCAALGEAMRRDPARDPFQAEAVLRGALRLAEATDEVSASATAAFRLGMAALDAGASPATYRSALPAAGASARPGTDPCRTAVGGAPGGIPAFSCAATRAQEAGQPQLEALARLKLARLQFSATGTLAVMLRRSARREAVNGIEVLLKAEEIQPELLASLAEIAIESGEADSPMLQAAIAALERAGTNAPAHAALAGYIKARLALANGDLATAGIALRRAIVSELLKPAPDRVAEWHMWLAAADSERASLHLTNAYRALESVIPMLDARDPLTGDSIFTLRTRRIYEAILADRLARPGMDLAPIQLLVEAYRQAELESVFGDDCAPARNDPVRPADLRADEILLYPLLLDRSVELLFATSATDGYRRLSIPIGSRRDVEALIGAFKMAMSTGNRDESWRAPSRALYDLLIAPLEPELARLGPLPMIVVMPDAPFRGAPMAALTDSEGRFLVEKARLATAPALAFAQTGQVTADSRSKGLRVVAASVSADLALPAGFFPALGAVAEEAQAAAALGYGAVPPLEEFTAVQLEEALSRNRPDILHLATHASFNGRSDRSFIVSGDGAIPLSELQRIIGRNRPPDDQLDLLVLSACETAVGDDAASMGLAGAAVQSGAVSALASLWRVNDTSTGQLMRAFYAAYAEPGVSKAEALRKAQLSLAVSEDRSHPGNWASFILIGGWR